jgi:hypothetical protein
VEVVVRLESRGTGKSACHLRSPANTGCVQVANRKEESAVTCVQMCEYLHASAYLLISYLRVPVEARTCSGCDENEVILPFYYVAMYLIFWN